MMASKDLEEVVDEIFRNFLGEYHDHLCPSCNNVNPEDCTGCRKTGYNQTPCLTCDKDGIAFKNIREAKTSLLKAFQNHALNEQIDEIERLIDPGWKAQGKEIPDNSGVKLVSQREVTARWDELREQRRTLGRGSND